MEKDTQSQLTFYLTGTRSGAGLEPVESLALKPAMFAGYRDLTRLRYDFPVVLLAGQTGESYAESLSGMIDRALGVVADSHEHERTRKHALQIEQRVRTQTAAGQQASLMAHWDAAVADLESDDRQLAESAQQIRDVLVDDGPVVDCDAALASRLLQHAWSAMQRKRGREFRATIDRLQLQLADILEADFARSDAGRSAELLQAAVGDGFGDAFNFDALSRMLRTAMPQASLPESRRERIQQLIDLFRAQQFFPALEGAESPAGIAAASVPMFEFQFDSCSEALDAFRTRMPKLIALARAIAIAELEVDAHYIEARHNPLFAQFGANGLDPEEWEPFPDYLVCLNAAELQPADHVQLMEVLASGLPIKVLLQIDDILEESPTSEGHLTAGMRIRQIASMAMGLNEAYVLQSSASNLYRFRDQIWRGLHSRGPALFSVFSGASGLKSGISPYITSASAMDSRAFPAFTYDPSAGPNWAARFSLDQNAQVERDWPTQAFTYEDEQHQSVTEDLAFTVVDFVASDVRYSRHLARVPRARWNGSMIPVDRALDFDRKIAPDKFPSLSMVDNNNVLQRVIVDERLIREARRSREMWHSLQELGGVHSSHAENLLARERQAWESRALVPSQAVTPVAGPADVPASSPAPTAISGEPDTPERSPDEAYIETVRCSTCNECTQINARMFAYNANQQAYIVDVTAGTYAQLVEAAESCQVAIIHPGKPRNPNEPGLPRLLERAAAFP